MKFALFALFSAIAYAQPAQPIQFVSTSPSGNACNSQSVALLIPTGTLFTCQSGVYGAVGGSGTFNALTGDATSTASGGATTVVKVNGGSIPASAVAVGTNSSNQIVAASVQGSGDTKVLLAGTVSGTSAPLCTDANGGATTASCPSGGSSAFNAITGGTNTAAAMVVGSGASLGATGTGTIAATSLGNCTDASGVFNCGSDQLQGGSFATTGTGAGADGLGGGTQDLTKFTNMVGPIGPATAPTGNHFFSYPLVGSTGNQFCNYATESAVTNGFVSTCTLTTFSLGAITATFSPPLNLSGSTLSCPTCVVASSPGAGIAHFAGGTQTATSSPVSLTADVSGITPIANGGTGTASPALIPGTNVTITGSWPNQTINSTGGGGGSGTSVTSSTPVTVTANTTSEQFLMELALSSGYLNSLGQPFLINGSFLYTTPVAQTPTLTINVRLCTVSGCGSGTNRLLGSIVTTATLASSTNNNANISLLAYVHATGATGTLEVHGPLSIDLGALSTSADSIFNDVNTAASGTIDLTAALFVDFTVTTSTGSASNSITQRSGGIMPFAATAAPVTAVTATSPVASSGGVTPVISLNANGVTSAFMAVTNTRRTCVIDNDTQSATALTAAQFSGHCIIPSTSTIVEVDVVGGTQTLTGTATAPTFTGTSSIQIGKVGTSGSTGLLSAALATASGKACALTTTSGACLLNGVTSSGTVTISNTVLTAGDVLYVSAATADAAQTWYNVTIIYTVN